MKKLHISYATHWKQECVFHKKTKYDIENSDRLTYNKDTSYYFNKMFFGIL
jgi:hypothetical protein